MAYNPRTKEAFESGGLDWLTIFLFLGMVLFGWLAIFSAVYDPEFPNIFDTRLNSGRQLIFIGIAAFIGLILLVIDAKFYSAFGYVFYAVGVILCISVIFIGAETKGAKAWFALGSFKFQPVEIAKYGTALALSKYLSSYEVSFKEWKTKLISIGIVVLPMLVVLLQNDTGSAMVFLAFFMVLYREGLPSFLIVMVIMAIVLFVMTLLVDKFLLAYILAAIGALFVFILRSNRTAILIVIAAAVLAIGYVFSVEYVYNDVLQPHQRGRIDVLLGKGGDDWNIRQSKIAIGSGGFFGQGYLDGTQTKYDFVPEQSTDFIFCTIGEEFGFVGSAGVVLGFVFLMIRLVIIAERQKNKFSRIYAYSVACIFFIHFTINIGMTIGLVPVIGIPLPFFSYGGSSLIGFTILLFTLLKLDANRVNEIQSLND
ncbi:MAG: rod shape-determining protein RodA [Bacteroidetes bacterium]|nr:MAG: rod shape-determining protein RodA [Bacteroidota bacterium]